MAVVGIRMIIESYLADDSFTGNLLLEQRLNQLIVGKMTPSLSS